MRSPAFLMSRYLAFDLGAESGRAILGTLESERLTLEELQSVDKLFAGDALKVFDLKHAMAQRNILGAPGTREVRKQLARWRRILSQD